MPRLSLMLLALACAACATTPGGTTAEADRGAVAPASLRVGTRSFGAPSGEAVRAMVAFGFSGSYMLSCRPTVSVNAPNAWHLGNGNTHFDFSAGSPFAENEGVDAVWSTDIEAAGVAEVSAYVQRAVTPLVREWAADGKLFTAYTKLPDLGKMRAGIDDPYDPSATRDEAAIVRNVGWPLPYLSASRHEGLFVYRTGQVVLVHWAANDTDTPPVTLQTAIAVTASAMRDPAAQSEEERTGLDYFTGIRYRDVSFDGLVTLGPMVQPSPNVDSLLVPTYEAPDESTWQGFLGQGYPGKPIWYTQTPWGGGGLVDARTGKLIRFTRVRVGHPTSGPGGPFMVPSVSPSA